MIENAETGALENFNFEQLQKHVPELQKFNFPIDSYQFDPPMDSSDMEPEALEETGTHHSRDTTIGIMASSSCMVRIRWLSQPQP